MNALTDNNNTCMFVVDRSTKSDKSQKVVLVFPVFNFGNFVQKKTFTNTTDFLTAPLH